jgi:glycosyltransferase involved in cell wall biosynthesis
MPRRLLIVSPSHATRGGVETIINDLCVRLPSRGWDVVLGLAKGATFNDVSAYRAAWPGLPVSEIDGTKGTRQARLEALLDAIRRHRPDVVLVTRILEAYFACSIAKRGVGAPRLAVTIRGFEPQYLFDLAEHRTNVDLCVTCGKHVAAAVVALSGIDSSRVVSIGGGVHSPLQQVSYRDQPSVLRLGYVGRFAQSDKRVLDVVELLRHLDELAIPYQLRMVGAGPDEALLRSQLESRVQLGTVKFIGWRSREDLYRDVYPNLDVVLNFSPAEGVTMSPREAMAHGVVPVISRFCGLKAEGHYIDGVNCLTFPVGDVSAAAECIGRLARTPRLLEQLSRHALHAQQGIYGLEGSIDAWARALDRCVEMPPMVGPFPRTPQGESGRLSRFGLSPWVAQRIRDLLGKRALHVDPGAEWPNASGAMPPDFARRALQFVETHEASL